MLRTSNSEAHGLRNALWRLPASWLMLLSMLVQALFCAPAEATATLVLDAGTSHVALGPYLAYYEDPGADLTHEQVVAIESEGRFAPVEAISPNFGLTRSAYWLGLSLRNADPERTRWILELADARMQYIDVYLTSADGRVTVKTGGGMRPYRFRDARTFTHAFELSLPPGETARLMIRVQSVFAVVAPLNLWSQSDFVEESRLSAVGLALYLGIVIAMLCYNGLLWLTLRDSGYGYYVGFLFSSFLNIGCFYGLFDEFISDASVVVINWLFIISYTLLLVFSQQFTRALFSIPTTVGVRMVWYQANMVLFALSVGLSLVGSWFAAIWIVPVAAISTCVFVLWSGIVALRQKNIVAIYFLSAWVFVIMGGTLLVFYSFGLLPYNALTKNAWIIGSSMEMILLSLALSARMRKLRDDNASAQAQVIEQQQIALEQQKQLVEQEKMASIGLLSAGVAHEINNPNNVVNLGAQTAEARIRELQQFVDDLLADEADDDMRGAFQQRFDGILGQMKLVSEGSQRIAGIVRSMRGASRIDSSEAQWFDPVEGLVETLELVKSNFSQVARFDVSGLEVRPSAKGFASRLNQVFMNLLVNACHAIEEKKKLTDSVVPGLIRLGSVVISDELVISIADSGCGMSPEVQARLFQPFFTTKGKDKGTGLGLGICRTIVKEHGGRLEVESAPGVGTTFYIVLPLSPASTDEGAGADR